MVSYRAPPHGAASQRHEHSRHAGLSLRGLASEVGCQCRCHNSNTNTGRERKGSGQPLALDRWAPHGAKGEKKGEISLRAVSEIRGRRPSTLTTTKTVQIKQLPTHIRKQAGTAPLRKSHTPARRQACVTVAQGVAQEQLDHAQKDANVTSQGATQA